MAPGLEHVHNTFEEEEPKPASSSLTLLSPQANGLTCLPWTKYAWTKPTVVSDKPYASGQATLTLFSWFPQTCINFLLGSTSLVSPLHLIL